ncbi:protein-glutamine gamma-glutamyltransferase E [Acanthopagrus schlegelii]
MTDPKPEEVKESVFKEVDFHFKSNNLEHRTKEISSKQLIVRRGQPFSLTVKLTRSFNSTDGSLFLHASTGAHPSQERGTASLMSIPAGVQIPPSAKAVWKAELDSSSSPELGILKLTLTPPADAPVGKFTLVGHYSGEEQLLATLVVLFNPWCPEDWVYLPDQEERQEYVMNEKGKVFRGSGNYITSMTWDFGQFEEDMVTICMMLLDLNHKHQKDPADDVSARCNPIYVSRVVSAMINSQDDRGVLQGRWVSPYIGGHTPSHWSGSHAILRQWFRNGFYPVKYGQCWVFASVMCSVMRFLGIPCRVVTNYQSAHDVNANLLIDMYHSDYGVREIPSHDSIWNYHVWTEGWMKRPDLSAEGKFDGWQVLDPTPQEKSDGVYCCGPASVKAILSGETHIKYDMPFVFAEVNADCVDWLVKADGTKVKIWSDTGKVGQNISTKSVGSDKRNNITSSYKHEEGSEKERAVFEYAITRDFAPKDSDEENNDEGVETEEPGENGNETTDVEEETPVTIPPLSIRFEEESEPVNGQDVKVRLVLHSEATVARQLSISISVVAMGYNGREVGAIQQEMQEKTLLAGKELLVPILVPFSAYSKLMVESDTMKVEAVVTDKKNPDHVCLAEDDIVLKNPPISVEVEAGGRQYRMLNGAVVFANPVNEILTDCTLTLSGCGLFSDEIIVKMKDIKPKTTVRVKFAFYPYKTGKRTLYVDFDCSLFRDIKKECTVIVAKY